MRAADGSSSLFDGDGRRKYLCEAELARFHAALRSLDLRTRTLGRLLALTGCRLSEALALTPQRLDPETGRVVFRTLKRRRADHFRAVPVPDDLMRDLRRLAVGLEPTEPLWPLCRQTAWRRISQVMRNAGVRGPQATAKGLRHGFGVANAERNIPTALTQRWMGHARPETTAIYQHVLGREERSFAERLWYDQ